MKGACVSDKNLGFEEFARLVIDALEAAELEYLVGGAVAVWAWAEPRSTMDFDVVVNLPGNRIRQLSQELARRDMLVPPEILLDLLMRTEGDLPANAIHLYSGYKADIYMLRPGDEYRATCLARKRRVDFGPPFGEIYVHSPEDLMLNKVHYYGLSQQTKHIRDIASIVAYLDDRIDWPYFNEWVTKLGLQTAWAEVKYQVDRLLGKAH